ncbi:hypothetical protein [Natranaeroarchaeum sulfidigenes]|nr:hypothetical protein [Natranaeroarchaeum sulfidigenes]
MSRGPADATAGLFERAVVNTLMASVIIPFLQLFLLSLVDAIHDAPVNEEVTTYLYSGVIVLSFIPILTTIGATLFAYAIAGLPGVFGYYLVAIGISGLLGANLTGALILFTGLVILLIASAVKVYQNRSRRPRGGMYR